MNQLKTKFKGLILLGVLMCVGFGQAMAQLGTDGPATNTDCCSHPWLTNFSNLYPANSNLSVVIGQTNPTLSSFYKLNVSAPSNKGAIYGRSSGATRAVYGNNGSSNGWAGYFYGNGYMRGSVGIGTTSLTDKLNVIGDIGLTGNIKGREVSSTFDIFANTNSSDGPYLRLYGTSSADPGRISIVANGGGSIRFLNKIGSSWAQHMQINSNGGVGIGTENVPSGFKLAVRGGIVTEEVKVELCGTGGWCDYVFEEDYKLLTLAEVAAHIEEKGHLHNTPSAKEVEENGLLLKEMTINQQEKIEEIFLHLIEMEKENKALKAELKEMKTRLAKTENK